MRVKTRRGQAILDHGRTRGPSRLRVAPDPIDLGNEPPLGVDGGPASDMDRRRVSAQWFSGTILTGLCGAALMGGAVYASLDGQANFAAVPERIEAALRGTIGAISERVAATTHKSDKLPTASEVSVTRQVIRVSTTSHVGDHENVRVRPYIHVATNLALATSELSAGIPPFNPQRLLADASAAGNAADGPPDAEPDAEVSFVTRDLGTVLPRAKVALDLPVDDALARVREIAEWTGNGPATAQAGLPGTRLAYAAEGQVDPYAGFEARIVPENITLLSKTAPQVTGGNPWNERTVVAKRGETVGAILRDLGATSEEIRAIIGLLGPRGREGGIKEGQKLRILLAPADLTLRPEPIRVMLLGDSGIEAAVALSDANKYVSVDVQHVETDVAEAEEGGEDDDANAVRLYQSVYETALRNQVPRPVIDDLIRIYSYDVDFQRRVQPGDSFEVLYSGDEEASDAKKDVLFATLTIGGEVRKYYRFQTTDDNVVDYYDETGKSAKKFLVRKPVVTAVMRSGFGMRRHPVLGYMKMHTGVDWAAPNGTPIYAAGDGLVEKAGWEAGYGKYVRLGHTNGYETAYGHLSGFARGIQPGVHVRQGQIIGYVGSTGLSTGAHCHFEIMVNGRFVDPMRIKLPRGRVLEGPLFAGFERERDQLDALLASRATGRVAQTALPISR
jgi:murein DD-endopeptidase MepM/ murein hydrolase activator NlpD